MARLMTLSAALARNFRVAIRKRGAAYLRDGRVRIEASSGSRVTARVRGAMSYDVELERRNAELRAACTCMSFDREMCKHVWAVILAADERKLLQGDGRGRVVLTDGAFASHGASGSGEPTETDASSSGARNGYDEDAFDDGLDDTPDFAEPQRGREEPLTPGDWRQHLGRLRARRPTVQYRDSWPATRELMYVVDAAASAAAGGVRLEILQRDLKKDGTYAKPKARLLPPGVLTQLPDGDDKQALAILAGATQVYGSYDHGYGTDFDYRSLPYRYRLTDPQPEFLLPLLCRTGRCFLRLATHDDPQSWRPLAWDDGEPWQFRLRIARTEDGSRFALGGELVRGTEIMRIDEPVLLTSGGVHCTRERAGRFEHGGAFAWASLLRKQGALEVPADESAALLEELMAQPALPAVVLPDELRYEQVEAVPRPRLVVKRVEDEWRRQERVRGELGFDYAGTVVARDQALRGIVQSAERRILLRNETAEREAADRLEQLGWREHVRHSLLGSQKELVLAASRLPNVVRELTQSGWHVEAEGKAYRSAGRIDLRVSSGVDWFELHGSVDFGDGATAQLPELLAAVRRGETTVRLGDGSFGLLPEQWLARYGMLAGLGSVTDDHLRFKRTQAALLDALLAAEPEATFDAAFEKAREELARFRGIRPAAAPPGFRGTLRGYQQEGLGWFEFLREFGFGGCLADDMGLGKTIQVLALLEARRQEGVGRPSLVVVPKSLVFNWKEEAKRFAPQLRVANHTGQLRGSVRQAAETSDIVLTTYGTVRNDVADFKDVRFDYVILDEAQAIKNAASASAKAVRLLRGDHRLALSGTPIENHLGELWSLFEFLNPGMLGTATVFKSLSTASGTAGEDSRKLLAQAARPFLLRRTKAEVLSELPPKVEQTLYCDLDKRQRKLYDELRDHYRGSLLKRIEADGINRAKIQVLEALLRLRQAAIHPGLIDKRRAGEPSAKLDMLLPQLEQVLDEGYKTLVFSQFTSMLAILRDRLDAAGVRYEYLDGQTRDREARVRRFQNDADSRLFLISLKAGGLGLNLTAAQYVFLLDPWWNPAVEAQAIDRAHRIGQREKVFAYRLIARDTIEEKVLALQSAKRELADAIIGADNALIRTLTKDDLELLLS